MTFKQFKNKPVIRFLSNRYVIILLVFVVWMVFFDENSYFIHRDLNKEIDQIEGATDYYQREISKDKKEIGDLQNPDSLEKFAREKYHMKKKDEDIYLIEFDTIKKVVLVLDFLQRRREPQTPEGPERTQRRSSSRSAWAERPETVMNSARTGWSSPWMRIERCPSRSLRPRVPAAW